MNQNINFYCNPNGKRQLAPGFQPGPYDVICARGKQAAKHPGNVRFHALVKVHQEGYSTATCKYQKSKIVSHIVNTVRQASPEGGFVKQIDGVWWEVGDRPSKEKIGQTFRDLLHNQYSSSTKAKARVRVQRRMNKNNKEEQQEETKPVPIPSATPITTSKRRTTSDDARSSVSVVSWDDDAVVSNHGKGQELPMATPAFIEIPTPPQQQAEELSLADTFQKYLPVLDSTPDYEPLTLDAVSSHNVITFDEDIEHSTTSMMEDSFDIEMHEFCDLMGVAL